MADATASPAGVQVRARMGHVGTVIGADEDEELLELLVLLDVL